MRKEMEKLKNLLMNGGKRRVCRNVSVATDEGRSPKLALS